MKQTIQSRRLFTYLTLFAAAICVTFMKYRNNDKIELMEYPQTLRGDVVEDYFGTEVADPYRWLEDDLSSETAEWVKAENAVTTNYLEQIPYREEVKNRLIELWNYAKLGAPAKHGDYFYYFYNDGLQNQSVLYRTADLEKDGEVILDPNTLSEDGTVALGEISFSKDGRYLAYAASASGSDWVKIYVMDTSTGELTSDIIEWVKFSGASWAADSKGFYYSAYDAPKGSALSEQNQFQKVYYHALGENQSQDKLIFEDPSHPLRYHSPWESEDGKWQFVLSSEGTSGSEILYRRTNQGTFKVLLAGFDYDYAPIDCKEDTFYYRSNQGAMNYALMAIDLVKPAEPRCIIAENEKNLLDNVSTAGGWLFASYLEDAQSKVYKYNYEGELQGEVELPSIGTVGGFSAKAKATDLYYVLTNYTSPATIYHYDIASGKSELYKSPEVNFDPSLYTTEQVFFTSKDGTKVPMFISHRKDIKLDGSNPTYLYGYGGFQINLTPSFNPSAIMFMEQGGVHCVVNLRGGSEYGEAWHKAGMLENKQNVFDDFISAGEWLVENKYTSSEKLAIAGGSNGGLLVGACLTQRPDLFAVALPAVGVMDMLRYHKFTIGWGWAVEYGSSDNEEQFQYIYKYSPLHNIKQGVNYPATLITTADHDDRVVPAHSFKFAAELQHCDGGENPILIRIESKAGHGAGKPTSKRIEEAADIYSFLFANTATTPKF